MTGLTLLAGTFSVPLHLLINSAGPYNLAMAAAEVLEKRRKKLPRAVVHAVHLEAGFQCARPQCRLMLVLDCHHIWWVKDGGGNDQSNLICLCPYCHTLYHQGIITDEAIRHWKALLV